MNVNYFALLVTDYPFRFQLSNIFLESLFPILIS